MQGVQQWSFAEQDCGSAKTAQNNNSNNSSISSSLIPTAASQQQHRHRHGTGLDTGISIDSSSTTPAAGMASTLTVVSQKRQSRAKIKLEIEKLNLLICQDYPRSGLDHDKLLCMLDPSAGYVDPNADYGAHRNNLQFPVHSASGMKFGTRSLGLRYENEHSEVYYGYKMCQFSRQHLQFLLNIQRAIYLSHPSSQIRNATQDYMRVNLVVGAQTGEHTDTFRGATPNFIFIEPGNTFHLRIRLFPKFHSSVVSYKGDYYIPHQYSPARLVMIGKNDKGDPHYFKFPPSTIDKLEPVGDLHSFIVVGIKQKKIQTAPSYYSVHHTTATLNIVSLADVLQDAKKHPVLRKPRPMFQLKHETNKWHIFYGWKHVHKWVAGTDSECRRIHVFYRPIREEVSASRARFFTWRD